MTRVFSIGGSPGVGELLSALEAEANGHGHVHDFNPKPSRAAELLKRGYDELNRHFHFEKGDFCRPKRNIENGYNTPPGGGYVFLRYLTPDEATIYHQRLQKNAPPPGAARWDCLVGALVPCGDTVGAVMELPHTADYLEPWHPFEAEKQG